MMKRSSIVFGIGAGVLGACVMVERDRPVGEGEREI